MIKEDKGVINTSEYFRSMTILHSVDLREPVHTFDAWKSKCSLRIISACVDLALIADSKGVVTPTRGAEPLRAL